LASLAITGVSGFAVLMRKRRLQREAFPDHPAQACPATPREAGAKMMLPALGNALHLIRNSKACP
jgi:hypothetical protein